MTIKGHSDLLSVLIRNLVDNALRYSPPQTEVRRSGGRRRRKG